jgi:hypothetical protein
MLVAFAAPCGAESVYKCVGSDNVPRFQDHPCRADDRSEVIALDPLPPAPPRADSADAAAPAAPTPAPPAAADVPDARPPAPVRYACVRADGSRYLTDTLPTQQTAVPLGVLGVPGSGLAEAYGGRNGIGVSAPGLRTPPVESARHNPLAGGYVWTEDACRPLTTFDACSGLRDQLRETERKLRRAFKDDAIELERNATRLREELRGC